MENHRPHTTNDTRKLHVTVKGVTGCMPKQKAALLAIKDATSVTKLATLVWYAEQQQH